MRNTNDSMFLKVFQTKIFKQKHNKNNFKTTRNLRFYIRKDVTYNALFWYYKRSEHTIYLIGSKQCYKYKDRVKKKICNMHDEKFIIILVERRTEHTHTSLICLCMSICSKIGSFSLIGGCHVR